MAVRGEQIPSPLGRVRLRRIDLSRYFKLDGARYMLLLAIIFCLLSMMTLVQTGITARMNYELVELRQQQVRLNRHYSYLQEQLARAQSVETRLKRASELGFRPPTPDQIRYVRIPELPNLEE
ncbi:MAG: cell division protein FtsL [Chloroflexus sp.]